MSKQPAALSTRIRAGFFRRANYVLAIVVGTLINLYGQLLVPWLSGHAHPLDAWLGRVRIAPGVVVLTTVLGYLFPLVVSVVSAAFNQIPPTTEA